MASKVVERQARVPEVTSSNPAQSWAYFFHAETQHINRIEHFEVCESVTQKLESDLRSQVLAHTLCGIFSATYYDFLLQLMINFDRLIITKL